MSIREYLRSHSVPFVAVLHRPVPTATRLAHSMHVDGKQVAKGVLIRTGEGFALAVIPSTHRVSLDRLAGLLGQASVSLATEAELQHVFHDCEYGAIPPSGRLYGLSTFLDSALSSRSELVLPGNTRHEAIRIRLRDYMRVESPRLGRLADPIHPPRRKLDRKAG